VLGQTLTLPQAAGLGVALGALVVGQSRPGAAPRAEDRRPQAVGS
jgi:hypothetical protein